MNGTSRRLLQTKIKFETATNELVFDHRTSQTATNEHVFDQSTSQTATNQHVFDQRTSQTATNEHVFDQSTSQTATNEHVFDQSTSYISLLTWSFKYCNYASLEHNSKRISEISCIIHLWNFMEQSFLNCFLFGRLFRFYVEHSVDINNLRDFIISWSFCVRYDRSFEATQYQEENSLPDSDVSSCYWQLCNWQHEMKICSVLRLRSLLCEASNEVMFDAPLTKTAVWGK